MGSKSVFVYDDTLDNALRIERALKREAEVLGEEAPEILVGSADDEDAGAAPEGDAAVAGSDTMRDEDSDGTASSQDGEEPD